MENKQDPMPSNKQEESTQQGPSKGGKKSDKRNDDLIKFKLASKRNKACNDIEELVEHMLKLGAYKEPEREMRRKNLFESWKYSGSGSLGDEQIGVKLTEVETQPIDWLWQRRIPLGKITLLDGDPGVGKPRPTNYPH